MSQTTNRSKFFFTNYIFSNAILIQMLKLGHMLQPASTFSFCVYQQRVYVTAYKLHGKGRPSHFVAGKAVENLCEIV